MNNEIKMSDVFDLPLQPAVNELAVIDNRDVVVGWVDNFFGEDARDYFIEAINNHDRLTEENKRLRQDVLFLARSKQQNEIDSHYRLNALVSMAASTLKELDGEK